MVSVCLSSPTNFSKMSCGIDSFVLIGCWSSDWLLEFSLRATSCLAGLTTFSDWLLEFLSAQFFVGLILPTTTIQPHVY